MKQRILKYFLTLSLVFLSVGSYSQPTEKYETQQFGPVSQSTTQEEENPDPGDEPTRVPLDGGLLWLLLAGAGYGVKKIVDHKKKQRDL